MCDPVNVLPREQREALTSLQCGLARLANTESLFAYARLPSHQLCLPRSLSHSSPWSLQGWVRSEDNTIDNDKGVVLRSLMFHYWVSQSISRVSRNFNAIYIDAMQSLSTAFDIGFRCPPNRPSWPTGQNTPPPPARTPPPPRITDWPGSTDR